MRERHTLTRFAASLSFVSVFAASTAALAEPSASERARADALFREARRLAEAAKWSPACTKFAESQRLDPQLGTLLYLATCHEKEGKLASAWTEFTEARGLAASAGQKEREKIARERATAIEPRMARVAITVTDPPPGLEVKLDGNALAATALATPQPLDPGEHTLSAAAPDREPYEQTFTVSREGEVVRETVPRLKETPVAVAAPPPPPAPPPPREEPAEHDASAQRTLGFVVAGVGVVGLGAGAFFGVRALGLKSDADKLCDPEFCSQEGLDKHDEAKTQAHISTAGFALGVVGLGVGTVLIVTAGSSSSPPSTARAAVAGRRWTIAPALDARGGGGLVARGRF